MAVSSVVIERDLGWKAIVKQLKGMNGMSTDIGLFGSGSSPKDNIAARGAVMEWGSHKNNIPSRPFNRQTWDKNLNKIKKVSMAEFGKVVDQKKSGKKALFNIGEWFTGKLKEGITSGKYKALSEKTVRQKGSSVPLIDTGLMKSSITHKEKKK